MFEPRILIVEDDASVSKMLVELLNKSGYQTEATSNGQDALDLVKSSLFHLYLVDLYLPGINGLEVLKSLRKIDSEAVIVLLTGFGTIESAVDAMKAGAYEFVSKPFQKDLVLVLIKKALDYYQLKHEHQILKKTVQEKYRFENIIGNGPAMQKVFEMIEKVTSSGSTILIQGESGTGKEVIAKTIHFNSPRRENPLVPINCGAIPESLLESELFGHEKGAFTGATSSRLGRFELAHGGTLFLDEISEMPLPLQVKLLRVLQEREFERVGGTKTIHVDVRIIAATNQDLEEAVLGKRFRKDLFYRLNVIPINVPPLREHKEDILLLIDHFMRKFKEKNGRNIQDISKEAQKLLLEYPWPGNIRELENLVERLITLKQEGQITVDDLPEKCREKESSIYLSHFQFPEEGINFTKVVTEFEIHLFHQALTKANGIKNKAAQLLQLNRTTLVERLKKMERTSKTSQEEEIAF
ncbi:MAG: sigma-54-dependent Fis family transcriptional regulator [Nitrospirae bacterium]|nr:sigma-54-dependent Fis family transcriptional regulator [Nitrospirota bacterium]MBI3351835.1 sigma-54-dependent Fis family transcriptional regulator [Nitrospirota bacterium]